MENSHDFLFLCQPLQLWAASLSCICWDARHRAGLCPLPESRKNILMTKKKKNYRDETQTAELLPTLSLELILTPQDSRYSTMSAWPVLVATCRRVLHNCNVYDCIHCDWVICMQVHIEIHKEPTVYLYKTYSMYTNTQVWVPGQIQITCTFTLSLTFRSAPWLHRALMTPRLPPLQAQCRALEPSWNTVGGTYPINSADFRPLEAAALVCEDNLTQSHHHLCKQAMCPHVLLDL